MVAAEGWGCVRCESVETICAAMGGRWAAAGCRSASRRMPHSRRRTGAGRAHSASRWRPSLRSGARSMPPRGTPTPGRLPVFASMARPNRMRIRSPQPLRTAPNRSEPTDASRINQREPIDESVPTPQRRSDDTRDAPTRTDASTRTTDASTRTTDAPTLRQTLRRCGRRSDAHGGRCDAHGGRCDAHDGRCGRTTAAAAGSESRAGRTWRGTGNLGAVGSRGGLRRHLSALPTEGRDASAKLSAPRPAPVRRRVRRTSAAMRPADRPHYGRTHRRAHLPARAQPPSPARRYCRSLKATSRISYSRCPFGVRTVTVSPASRPMSARATGAVM